MTQGTFLTILAFVTLGSGVVYALWQRRQAQKARRDDVETDDIPKVYQKEGGRR